jgi:hypothetical protein
MQEYKGLTLAMNLIVHPDSVDLGEAPLRPLRCRVLSTGSLEVREIADAE